MAVENVAVAPHETLLVGAPGHWWELRTEVKSTRSKSQCDFSVKWLTEGGDTIWRLSRTGVSLAAGRKLLRLPAFWPTRRPVLQVAIKSGQTVVADTTVQTSAGAGDVLCVVSSAAFALSGLKGSLMNECPEAAGLLSRLDTVVPVRGGPHLLAGEGLMQLVPDSVPLPHHPLCWSGISHIVWQGIAPSALSEEQQRCLRWWLLWGGTLILSGGQDAVDWEQSLLADIVPASYSDAMTLDLVPFQTEGDVRSRRLRVSARRLQIRFTDGVRWLYTPEGEPYGLERSIGFGRVIQLGFSVSDPTFDSWTGKGAYWVRWLFADRLGQEGPVGPIFAGRDLGRTSPVNAGVLDPEGPAVESFLAELYRSCGGVAARWVRGLVAGVLGGYVLVVALVHTWAVRRRSVTNWAVLPFLSAVAVGIVVLQMGISSARVSQIELAETFVDADVARRTRYVAIAGARRQRVDLVCAGRNALALELDALRAFQQRIFGPREEILGELSLQPTRLNVQLYAQAPRGLLVEEFDGRDGAFFPYMRATRAILNGTPHQLRDVTLVSWDECILLANTWQPGQELVIPAGREARSTIWHPGGQEHHCSAEGQTDDSTTALVLSLIHVDRVLPRPFILAWSDDVEERLRCSLLLRPELERTYWFVFFGNQPRLEETAER